MAETASLADFPKSTVWSPLPVTLGAAFGRINRRRATRSNIHLDHAVIHFPFRLEPPVGGGGAAGAGKRPDKPFPFVPVLWQFDFEDEQMSPGIEMGGLAHVFAQIKPIIGADRNVRLLIVVPIEIAEPHYYAAVGQLLRAFEKGLYVFAGSAGETVLVRKQIYDALSMQRERHFQARREQRNSDPTLAPGVPLHGVILVRSSQLLPSGLPIFESLLVLVIRQIVERQPGKAHIVDGPLSKCNGVGGIRIELVAGGVVEPRRDVQDGPRRNDRLRVFLVVVDDVPIEVVPVDATLTVSLGALPAL